MTDYSRTERHALCDLFHQVGPDHPTLCSGWDAHDLAVHLWVRESDPKAGPGLVLTAFSETTAQRSAEVRQRWTFTELVDRLREGPPRFSIFSMPVLGSRLNVIEFLVHHEDVRRAGDGAEPRALSPGHQNELWRQFLIAGRGLLRGAPTGVEFRRPDGTTAKMRGPRDDGPTVTVTGEPAELVLFGYGRGAVARVRLDGDEEAVSALRLARSGS